MKVLLLTHGSRGDVQPFVALAHALNTDGHHAILGAPAGSAFLAEAFGVHFIPLRDPQVELMGDPVARTALHTSRRSPHASLNAFQVKRQIRSVMNRSLDDMATAAKSSPDIVVYPPIVPAHEIAEVVGAPGIVACFNPTRVPTRSLSNPMLPFRVPRALNRVSYLPTNLWAFRDFGNISRWRRQTLGLPRRHGHRNFLRRPDGTPATVIHAFSKFILPNHVHYPESVHTTGFWFLPSPPHWEPSRGLSEFLAAGDPPIYIGFGSMARTDPARNARIINEAVRIARVRAVVVAGWGGIETDQLSDDIFHLDEAPLGWLFPRMAAVVHHGGAGTMSHGFASGRPQVVCPFTNYQHYLGRQLHLLGVAPSPVPQRSLNSQRLASAIKYALTDRALAVRAEELGRRIRAEEGTAEAIKILETMA